MWVPEGRRIFSSAKILHPAPTALSTISAVGWTIFTAIDLWMGVFRAGHALHHSFPEKLPRLRTARRVILAFLAIAIVALLTHIARRYG